MKTIGKFMCALALVLPFTVVAAEQNPLQSLANALGKLAPASTNQTEPQSPGDASSTGEFSSEDAEILRLLEIQFDDHYKQKFAPWYCDANSLNIERLKEYNEGLQIEVAKGDYAGARAQSNITARHIAYCAVHRHKYSQTAAKTMDHTFFDFSLADWAAMVGSKVVVGLKYTKASGLDLRGSVEQKSAARAKSFLMYAKLKGVDVEVALKGLSELTEVKIVKASVSADFSGSAVSLVEKFTSNKFGFEQKYLGKTIETYGNVLTISGSKKYASVAILGNTKLSMDNLGFQHRIECIVTSPESMSKAGDLQKGKKVRVRGVFDHDTRFNMMAESQINLSGCEILQ